MLHNTLSNHALAVIALSALAVPAAGQTINEDVKLLPSDGAEYDFFGRSVAISGTTALLGTPRDDDNGNDSGSAYVFDTTTGQQLFKLFTSDGTAEDYFGVSVAISGSTAVVAAVLDDDNGNNSGSAYIFDTTTGQQLFKLLPSDGAAEDEFGRSVAISGATALIGAYHDDDNGSYSGSAYLFDTTTGQQLFKLLPNDGASQDRFGFSVAISGTTAMVGTISDSVYIFDTTTGQQLFKLLPTGGSAGGRFGWSVAISGTTAVVGDWLDNVNGISSGSAYLFDTTTGQQLFKLLPSDGASGDYFGVSASISGTTVVVGAERNDDYGTESGSAYVFDVSPSCPADTNGDGILSPADFSAWVAAFNAMSAACDQNGDTLCTPADFSAWVANYNAGC